MATTTSSSSFSSALSLAAGAAAFSATLYLLKQQKAGPAATSTDGSVKKWTAEDLIANRRSIFPDQFDPTKKVPRELLEKMLEAANWAPTHARTEPWRFVVFESPEEKTQLGELEQGFYKKFVPADKFLQKKYDKIAKSKAVSSYVIAICMKRQESELLPEVEEICSVACAVQNMHLVASAHGVGAYWSSVPPFVENDMKAFLGLDAKDRCIGMFYVGVPKEGIETKGARKPIAEKVSWK
jgi:nitroreductase